MKTFTTLLALTLCLSTQIFAQTRSNNKELRGNGKVITKSYTVATFEAIEIEQFPPNVVVEVSDKTPFLSVSLDENLVSQLQVISENGILKLALKDPDDKDFWVSKADINVKISTKNLKSLRNGSNGNVTVTGLKDESFNLINDANGSITLQGKSTTLNLVSHANGNIDAEKFSVETANVTADANATIRLNTQRMQVASKAFARVENVNDAMTASKTKVEMSVSPRSKLVTLQFVNNSASSRQITLISYAPQETGNETNGFTLAPYQKKEKQYQPGTKVYIATQAQIDMVMGDKILQDKPFLTVQADDEGRKILLSGK
ncbi:GIN domain-containing protein [Dyadobacter arcticus]|uniref:Putative auto-transporter adhesin head GIN domain-containing protein n=1 Tax=Dyadobacter arcticus TaxID=1078754 RepID=A0ABX0UKV1_9BACT|nr:DUF2807 domain-containing protein [Dyadobacter arcticus]NIJ52709.1 hypothetical protein [Dyadobacter arcticus]